jgi:hypothetical protein
MAQYKHLPIYKATYELLELITRKTKEFPKDFKFSLGNKLRDECVDLVMFVYKANSSKNKNEYLSQIVDRIQVIELIIRLCKDMNLINVEAVSKIVTLTDSIARQAQGWSNHSIQARQNASS